MIELYDNSKSSPTVPKRRPLQSNWTGAVILSSSCCKMQTQSKKELLPPPQTCSLWPGSLYLVSFACVSCGTSSEALKLSVQKGPKLCHNTHGSECRPHSSYHHTEYCCQYARSFWEQGYVNVFYSFRRGGKRVWKRRGHAMHALASDTNELSLLAHWIKKCA